MLQGHGLSGKAFAQFVQGFTTTRWQGQAGFKASQALHFGFSALQGLQFLKPLNGFKLNELVFCPIPIYGSGLSWLIDQANAP